MVAAMATASTVSRKSSQLVGIRPAVNAAMCPASVVGCCCCCCACNFAAMMSGKSAQRQCNWCLTFPKGLLSSVDLAADGHCARRQQTHDI